MVLGATLGARSFFILSRPHTWNEPGAWLKFWQGGMVSYGGLLGSLLALHLFRKGKKLSTLPLLDLLAPSFLLAWALGRLGCFLNWHGEGGTPSDLPWAVEVAGQSYHPVMLYTSALLALAWAILETWRGKELGTRTAWTALAYSSVRLLCDTWRHYEAPHLLTLSRLACLGLLALGLALLLQSRRIPQTHVESVS